MERVDPTIRLGTSGRGLKFVEALKVLGVTFDRRLHFFQHADSLKEKAEHLACRALTFLQMQGTLQPAALTHLYHQVMLPALTVQCGGLPSQTADSAPASQPCSARSCWRLSGAYRTTRTASLQVLMKVPPLSLELDRTAAEFKLFALREAVEFGDLAFSPRDILYPADPWGVHPAAMRAFSFAQLSAPEARSRSRAAGLHVFTDGSYTPHSSGAAFVVLGPRERFGAVGRFRVCAATSAYCAEVIAFAEASNCLCGHRQRGAVSLYTDCLSLLQAVATPGSADLRIVRIQTALGEVASLSEVRLYHVSGHCGFFGNELADFLASRAARDSIRRKNRAGKGFIFVFRVLPCSAGHRAQDGQGSYPLSLSPAMPSSRRGKTASPPRSPPRPPAAGGSPRSRGSDFSEDGDAVLARFSELVDQLAAAEDEIRLPAGGVEEEEALSSVSEGTAVAAAVPGDPGSGTGGRLREIIDEAVAFCNLPANRVPVEARTFFLTRLFEMAGLCVEWKTELKAETATERSAALALPGQLIEARREAAELHRRLAVLKAGLSDPAAMTTGPGPAGRGPAAPAGAAAAPSGAGGPVGVPAGRMDYAAALRAGLVSSASAARAGPGGAVMAGAEVAGPGAQHKHVAFLTPVATTQTPARDVLRLLKANVDPTDKDIRDVTLRHTSICTNIDFPSREGTPVVLRQSTGMEGSTEVVEHSQLEDTIYDASSVDELSRAGSSPRCATPAVTEPDRSRYSGDTDQEAAFQTERPRKIPRLSCTDSRSAQSVSHVDIASECLQQLRAVKSSQSSKEAHDLPYFFSMTIAQQLRLLNTHQQIDAITALQKVMHDKVMEAKEERDMCQN
ncbi:uncharacterized protein [Dermacentor albipictus]|uniref:uncharacterized protein n=1 Tax=Dermacentor albipictus TaxID=60249 RepID=UPI0038FD26A8